MQQESGDWNENIRMLTDSASAVVPADGSLARVRAARFKMPGFSREVWHTVVEMGWLGLRVSEGAGGLGLGSREAVAFSQILGRGLVPEPVLSAELALSLLECAGCGDVIDSVLIGAAIPAAAWQSAPNSLAPSGGVTLVDGRLTGIKIAVGGGVGADIFVTTVPGGIALVPHDAAGLKITNSEMHDGTFQAQLDFDGVASIQFPCTTVAVMDALMDAMLLHAAYLKGVADRGFEITLDHLCTRKQFDVAIGSFQALQHRASEIRVQQALAEAAIGAAAAMRDSKKDAHATILRARSRAAYLARLIAREAVQMHGAMGYTDEADIGLFVRKIMVEAGQFAPEYKLREQYMSLLHTDAGARK